MDAGIFIFLVIFHFIGDFFLQDVRWAQEKHHSWKALLSHTTVYSLTWFLPVWILTGSLTGTLWFIFITFITHTLVDKITAPIVNRRFVNEEYGTTIPNIGAFTIIGIDQVIHYIQLILTYDNIFIP